MRATRGMARRAYWAASAWAMGNLGLMFWDFADGHAGWAYVNGACTVVSVGTALTWQRLIPRLPEKEPQASKHDQALAEIARLERELADDGVLFLKSSAEFDAEVDRVVHPFAREVGAMIASLGPQFYSQIGRHVRWRR